MKADSRRIDCAGRGTTRISALTAYFEMVRYERMADVPILNPKLDVEAIGFQFSAPARTNAPADADARADADVGTDASADPLRTYDGAIGEGVLITPWFMSLVRLPIEPLEVTGFTSSNCTRDFGADQFEFLGHQESGADGLPGYFETCALFSPMNEFCDQSMARETAQHVLSLLRPETAAAQPTAGRRAFLTGGQSRRNAA